MPTRNVVLSDHQHDLVEALVLSGRYQNASEVLREGLRLIEERERIEQAKLKALRQAARQGWADVSAGRYTDVADDQLEDFVGQLGRHVAKCCHDQALIAQSCHVAELLLRPGKDVDYICLGSRRQAIANHQLADLACRAARRPNCPTKSSS